MKKIHVDGKVMWEEDKERFFNLGDSPRDLCGWKAVTIDGVRMWESCDGERSYGNE